MVPNYLKLDRMEMQYSELGRVAAIWSSRGDANAKACFGFTAPVQIDLHDRTQQQRVLADVYEGIGWEVPRLLELMPGAHDYYFDAADQIRMAHWSQGRVALVGDAGYFASPCQARARVSRSLAPTCWPENWRRRRAPIKPHFANMRKRCAHLS